MKWGILGAMPSEITYIRDQMEDVCQSTVGSFVFYDGTIYDKEVTLVQSGIGKVNAALACQILIDCFDVECLVNTGIAGAIHHNLQVLDVVISREVCYHDFDHGLLERYVPFLSKLEASEALVDAAVTAFEEIDHGGSCCFVGKIATGDIFVESKELKGQIIEKLDPMCVEMEGGAVGHACCANDIPFVVIRTMSDSADEDAFENAIDFEHIGAKRSADLVLQMIQNQK